MRLIGTLMNPIPAGIKSEIAILAEEFEALRQAEADRLDRYRQYRDELTASRHSKFSRDATDYNRKPNYDPEGLYRHRIALPFGQVLTVKHAFRLAGRLPDVVVDRRDNGPLEMHRSDTMEKIVWGTIRESQGDQQFATGAWDGSQIGSCAFDLGWLEAKQMAKFRCIDASQMLVVRGLDNPHDFQRVYRFWEEPVRTIRAEYQNWQFREEWNFVDRVEASGSFGTEPTATVVEACDKQRSIRFTLGGHAPLWEQVHGLGFVPYVVIPNLGPERSIWGWADYEFYRDIINYLPLMFGRQADVLRATAGAPYLDKQTGNTPKQIKEALKSGAVIQSKRDGDLVPVPGPQEPAFAAGHSNMAVEFLKMLGFAPDAAWGGSGSTSGSDRGLQLQPLLELTSLKQINWSAGLSRLFGMVFRMIEAKQEGKAIYRGSMTENGSRRSRRFQMVLDPLANPVQLTDPMDESDITLIAPATPRELFDGDYAVRFVFQNRIDPDDPAFVMSEVNKFVQGLQSARTTLERLGVQMPEDELTLIEEEAKRLPWLRNGMVQMIKMQLEQATQQSGGAGSAGGGGGQQDSAAIMAGLSSMITKDGSALDGDAALAAQGEPGLWTGMA